MRPSMPSTERSRSPRGHPRISTCSPASPGASAGRTRVAKHWSISSASIARAPSWTRNGARRRLPRRRTASVNRHGLGQSRRGFLRMLGSCVGAASIPALLLTQRVRAAQSPAAAGPPDIVFTDVTAAAGLSDARNVSGSPDGKQFLLEEMGCGVALFDYDNDGWLDIFLVNGSSF